MADIRKVLDTIDDYVKKYAEERYPGYKKDLKNVATNIILEENQHAIKQTSVQKNVSEECIRLGVLLNNKSPGS
jgi:hypothetical protein